MKPHCVAAALAALLCIYVAQPTESTKTGYKCAKGFSHYKTNNKCFYFSSDELSYSAAGSACAKKGAALATIDDAGEKSYAASNDGSAARYIGSVATTVTAAANWYDSTAPDLTTERRYVCTTDAVYMPRCLKWLGRARTLRKKCGWVKTKKNRSAFVKRKQKERKEKRERKAKRKQG